MLKIAFVEDQEEETAKMQEYCTRFSEESGQPIALDVFSNGLQFLSAYDPAYRLVFFDIEMPILNGMEAAKALYEMDKSVAIVFYTNMAKYAIKGYEVGALDFLVKPVTYDNFALKLRRAVEQIKVSGADRVMIASDGVTRAVRRRDIKYAEIISHDIVYHTSDGDIRSYGSLKKAEQLLGEGFKRCNSCYIVNLAFVDSVKGFSVIVDGKELSVSHLRKKEFMRALADYYGGKI